MDMANLLSRLSVTLTQWLFETGLGAVSHPRVLCKYECTIRCFEPSIDYSRWRHMLYRDVSISRTFTLQPNFPGLG